jgi:hypothetical protein
VPTAATIALEMIGPMPGTLISRSQPASWRASAAHNQSSLPGTGTSPPTDRKVTRRDAGNAEESSLEEREGNRVYCLSLPGGSYEAEDDHASGLMHIYRVTEKGRSC